MSFSITEAHNTTSINTVYAEAQTQQAYYFAEQEASLNELRCMNACMYVCIMYIYIYVRHSLCDPVKVVSKLRVHAQCTHMPFRLSAFLVFNMPLEEKYPARHGDDRKKLMLLLLACSYKHVLEHPCTLSDRALACKFTRHIPDRSYNLVITYN